MEVLRHLGLLGNLGVVSCPFSFPFKILLERVHTELCFELLQQTDILKPLMSDIVASTGKYVRTQIILRIAQLESVYTDDLGSALVTLCKGIECLHTASLLHDDVLDEGVTRRNRACFYRQWGEKHAILLGDHLLSTALAYILSLQSLEIMHEIQRALSAMTLGQIQEAHLSWESRLDVFEEVAYLKTAALFEACAGATSILLGNASSTQYDALRQYGKIVGLCFQVQDDVADYYRTQEGKNRFQDFLQGRITLPLVWLMQHMGQKERDQLRYWCTDLTRPHAERVYQSLLQHHIAEYAQQWSDQRFRACRLELEKHWPRSILDKTLVEGLHTQHFHFFT